MKKLFTFLCLVVLAFSACQKEPSFEDPNSNPVNNGGSGGGGSAATGLLARKVEVSGSDSTVYDFTYDAAKRLSFMSLGNSQFNYDVRITRSVAGIITKFSVASDAFASFGIDSVVNNVNYDNATGRYTSSIFNVSLAGIPYADSTVYGYDAGGKIASKISYTKAGPAAYGLSSKVEYTHTGANISLEKEFEYNSGTWDQVSATTYTYDAKINPLTLGIESVLFFNGSLYGPNNNTVFDYVDSADPTNNYTINSTYTYNTANKPSGGSAVETPGPVNYSLRFYYN